MLLRLRAVCATELPVMCAVRVPCIPRRSSALHCWLHMGFKLLASFQMLSLLLGGLLACS